MKIINFIKEKINLDLPNIIILILAIILNVILWTFYFKSQLSQTQISFSFGVLIINTLLSLIFSKKDILLPYFFLGTALLIQIFTFVLLHYQSLQIY